MGVKFGDIDANQIIENDFRIGVLERLMEIIFKKNVGLFAPTKEEILGIRKQVANDLKTKYPNSGIALKEE